MSSGGDSDVEVDPDVHPAFFYSTAGFFFKQLPPANLLEFLQANHTRDISIGDVLPHTENSTHSLRDMVLVAKAGSTAVFIGSTAIQRLELEKYVNDEALALYIRWASGWLQSAHAKRAMSWSRNKPVCVFPQPSAHCRDAAKPRGRAALPALFADT